MTDSISSFFVKTHYYSDFTPISPISGLAALITKLALKALSYCNPEIENSNQLCRYIRDMSYTSIVVSLVPIVGFVANAVQGYLNYKNAAELYKYACKIDHESLNEQDQTKANKGIAEAFNLYKEAAELGHVEAMEKVGEFSRFGFGTKANPGEAFRWYQRSSDWGNTVALFCLGECYNEGIGTNIDPKAAFNCFQVAAERGDSRAMKALADCYAKGTGVDKQDRNEAFKWYKQSVEKGVTSGMYEYALCLRNGFGTDEDEVKAEEYLIKAANNGDCRAALDLTEWYEKRNQQDLAAKFYEKAASLGNGKAAYKIACRYFNGNGVAKSTPKTEEWLKEAIKLKYHKAIFELALLYRYGHVKGKDIKDSVQLYLKACELKIPEGHYQLGEIYENEHSNVQAFAHYEKAAKLGHAPSIEKVGDCYYAGIGVEINYSKAMSSWWDAAKNNVVTAMQKAGKGYEDTCNHAVTRDPDEAAKWYCKAGEFYESKQNQKDAEVWFKKAAGLTGVWALSAKESLRKIEEKKKKDLEDEILRIERENKLKVDSVKK